MQERISIRRDTILFDYTVLESSCISAATSDVLSEWQSVKLFWLWNYIKLLPEAPCLHR